MRVKRIAVAIVAALVVVGAVAVALPQTGLLSTTTKTETFTTTAFENTRVTGTCTATSYFLGDIEEAFATKSAISSGNTTTYTYIVTSISSPTVQTLSTKTYTTTSYGDNASALVTSSTSFDGAYAPSSEWTVTVCTYS